MWCYYRNFVIKYKWFYFDISFLFFILVIIIIIIIIIIHWDLGPIAPEVTFKNAPTHEDIIKF